MKQKIRIAFVGCGSFCQHFVPLFKAHPAVEFIAVCDKFRDRAENYKERFGADMIFDSFDDVIASSEINTVAIFSQRDLHGQMAIAALKAGKHVYSAVPMALKIEEINEIVRLVKETGLTYMMGETGIYRPASIFCRRKFATGEMGQMVYAEAQYNHDMKRLYDVFKYTEGDTWKKMAGLPPFLYPTHSTSMVLSAARAHAVKVSAFGFEDTMDPDIFGKGMNYWDNPFSNSSMVLSAARAHAVKVSAFGFEDTMDPDIFGKGMNYWDNPFSNSSMLLKLSNNAIVRISENRRIAWHVPETWITCFNGTKASYECSIAQHSYIKMNEQGTVDYEDVSDLLNPTELTNYKGNPDFMQKAANGLGSGTEAPIQIVNRLPAQWEGLPTGHAGTHKFMVDDFCQAYVTGKLSPTNAWQAARYNLPGLVAHQCAMAGGQTMDVPDLGDPPAEFEVLSPDRAVNEDDYR